VAKIVLVFDSGKIMCFNYKSVDALLVMLIDKFEQYELAMAKYNLANIEHGQAEGRFLDTFVTLVKIDERFNDRSVKHAKWLETHPRPSKPTSEVYLEKAGRNRRGVKIDLNDFYHALPHRNELEAHLPQAFLLEDWSNRMHTLATASLGGD